jgi:hypothetical protein
MDAVRRRPVSHEPHLLPTHPSHPEHGRYARFNELARSLSTHLGASFLDVAAPSSHRPDGAMGGYWPRGDAKQRDCVHYCLPGVVDTWSTLLYNLVASPRVQSALAADAAQPARAAGRAPRSSGRFFVPNASEWLRVKGYAERFEACSYNAVRQGHSGRGACETRLQLQPWWAFQCIEPRDRRAVRGPDYAATWTPWMPAESFD